MRKLVMGIVEFREKMLPQYAKEFSKLALALSGWWFDIAAGNMYAYERESRSFKVIDREVAKKLVARLAARAR